MNHLMTWGDYFAFSLWVSAAIIAVLLVAAGIVKASDWWKDIHVNDESKQGDVDVR